MPGCLNEWMNVCCVLPSNKTIKQIIKEFFISYKSLRHVGNCITSVCLSVCILASGFLISAVVFVEDNCWIMMGITKSKLKPFFILVIYLFFVIVVLFSIFLFSLSLPWQEMKWFCNTTTCTNEGISLCVCTADGIVCK